MTTAYGAGPIIPTRFGAVSATPVVPAPRADAPLAARMRPRDLSEFVGQDIWLNR